MNETSPAIHQSVSIITPTYNEAENVGELVSRLRAVLDGVDYEILVVDDNSPDGTYYAAKQLAERDSKVKPMLRPRKLGLASAVMDGFRASRGELIVMMDCDLSHRPEDLPALLQAADAADIVIGSRYVSGGAVHNMPAFRQLASRTSIVLSRLMLGLKQHDTTSGFAVFRRDTLRRLDGKMEESGFKLLMEALVKSPGATVLERPITFAPRRYGKSKFGLSEVIRFVRLCWRLRRASRNGASR